jgi:hypothetical protein
MVAGLHRLTILYPLGDEGPLGSYVYVKGKKDAHQGPNKGFVLFADDAPDPQIKLNRSFWLVILHWREVVGI